MAKRLGRVALGQVRAQDQLVRSLAHRGLRYDDQGQPQRRTHRPAVEEPLSDRLDRQQLQLAPQFPVLVDEVAVEVGKQIGVHLQSCLFYTSRWV